VLSGSVIDVPRAATARVHGLTLVTWSIRDVEWTGLRLAEPLRFLTLQDAQRIIGGWRPDYNTDDPIARWSI